MVKSSFRAHQIEALALILLLGLCSTADVIDLREDACGCLADQNISELDGIVVSVILVCPCANRLFPVFMRLHNKL